MLIFNCSLLFLVFFSCSLASYQKPDDNGAFNDMYKLPLSNFNPIQPKNLFQSIPNFYGLPIMPVPNLYAPQVNPILNPYALQANSALNPYAPSINSPLGFFNLQTRSTFAQSPQNPQYKSSLTPKVLTVSKQSCFQPPKNRLEPNVLQLASQPNLSSFKLYEPQHPHPLNNGQNNFGPSKSDNIPPNQQILVQVPQNYQVSNQNISQGDSGDAQDVSQVDSDDDSDGSDTEFLPMSKFKVSGDENIKRSLVNLFKFDPTDLPKYEFVGGEVPLSLKKLSTLKDCASGDTVIFEKSQKTKSILHSYKCSICGQVFRNRTRYRDHANVHRNTGRHRCDLCFKRFTRKGGLKIHRGKHAEGFKFKCNSCNLRFATMNLLITHEKTHATPTQ